MENRIKELQKAMKRIWIANVVVKPRKIGSWYYQLKASSPEKILKRLLKSSHGSWVEVERIEILREKDDKRQGNLVDIIDLDKSKKKRG